MHTKNQSLCIHSQPTQGIYIFLLHTHIHIVIALSTQLVRFLPWNIAFGSCICLCLCVHMKSSFYPAIHWDLSEWIKERYFYAQYVELRPWQSIYTLYYCIQNNNSWRPLYFDTRIKHTIYITRINMLYALRIHIYYIFIYTRNWKHTILTHANSVTHNTLLYLECVFCNCTPHTTHIHTHFYILWVYYVLYFA